MRGPVVGFAAITGDQEDCCGESVLEKQRESPRKETGKTVVKGERDGGLNFLALAGAKYVVERDNSDPLLDKAVNMSAEDLGTQRNDRTGGIERMVGQNGARRRH